MKLVKLFLLTGMLAFASRSTAAESAFSIIPSEAVVSHPRFPERIIVTQMLADGTQNDLTRDAKYVSADPKIARVDSQGRIFPVAAGKTTVTVSAAGKTATVAVISQPISRGEGEADISYINEVQPILSQAGCNMGACHGYSLGKNGFRLSLRGNDQELDYMSITRDTLSRRLNRAAPMQSVLLTKPVGEVPHGGDIRLKKHSDQYQRLVQWIAEGAPTDAATAARVTSIEVFPKYAVLPKPGGKQQLKVVAHYNDGSSRDVTDLAIFTSGKEDYATVDKAGLVTMLRRAEVAVVVRFERIFAAANIAALDETPGFIWANPPERNIVDKIVFKRLKDLRTNPSELSTDEEFLRRVYLDLIGVQPSVEELRAFVDSPHPYPSPPGGEGKGVRGDKRDQVIEKLFARPEFVDHWSLKWGDLLQNSRRYMAEESMFAFRTWIRHAVASNMPLDKFARDVLTGVGPVRENPTAAFYRLSTDPNISLERTAQVFTGIRMLCARCHEHPFENWTQVDYYGLASFFNQVAEKTDVQNPKEKVTVLRRDTGFSLNPRTKKLQAPRYLGGVEAEMPAGGDRREVFVKWLTSPENPYFARSLTNRFWSYFFSRGIIDPVDDIRVTNPPINPELLDALTKEFVAKGFDIRHLMRTIVQSRTYQLSSKSNPTNEHDVDNFSHTIPRRLTAEQLFDSLQVATGVPESISGAPAGFRAAQVPDTEVKSEFLELFGRAPRLEACECERTSQTNMLQALHMITADSVQQKLASAASRVSRVVADKKRTDEQRIEEIYLAALCRQPSPMEMQRSLEYIRGNANTAEAYQDLMWALLNTGDFIFVR